MNQNIISRPAHLLKLDAAGTHKKEENEIDPVTRNANLFAFEVQKTISEGCGYEMERFAKCQKREYGGSSESEQLSLDYKALQCAFEDPVSNRYIHSNCYIDFDMMARCISRRLLDQETKYCREEHTSMLKFYEEAESKSSSTKAEDMRIIARRRWKECTVQYYKRPLRELLFITDSCGRCQPVMPQKG